MNKNQPSLTKKSRHSKMFSNALLSHNYSSYCHVEPPFLYHSRLFPPRRFIRFIDVHKTVHNYFGYNIFSFIICLSFSVNKIFYWQLMCHCLFGLKSIAFSRREDIYLSIFLFLWLFNITLLISVSNIFYLFWSTGFHSWPHVTLEAPTQ